MRRAAFCGSTFADNWSASIPLKKERTLVEHGPYEWVRHPIYTGLILMIVGSALVMARPMMLVAPGAVVLLVAKKIRREEELMSRSFPDAYSEYRSRVRALIPYVG